MTALDLAFRELGAGPPVLVLHGLLGQARNWQAVGRALAADRRVLLADLRNHGRSPRAPDTGYPTLASDLARLVERQGLGRPAVIGHSMGGKAAMALALLHPELVDRLAVVDVAPVDYGGGAEFRRYLDAMLGIDLGGLTRRAEAEAALAPAAPDPAVRSFLAANLEVTDQGLRWLPDLTALRAGLAAITGFPTALLERRFEGPVLVLRGARSSYVLPEHEPVLRRLFPRTEIRTVEGAGHWVHADRPDATAALLRAFLA